MRVGVLISLALWAAVFAVFVLVTGCSALPSMKYCDSVSYTRNGAAIHIEADCRAPVGESISGL